MAIAAVLGIGGLATLLLVSGRKSAGKLGEEYTSRALRLGDGYKLLNNLLFEAGNWTTEIDHIIVSRYGIFVIESKNVTGRIYGSDSDDEWVQMLGRRKHRFYNPTKQNQGHIRAIKNALYDYRNLNIVSIIVFSPRADLHVKTDAHVIYTHQLNSTIQEYTKQCLSDEQVDGIVKRLKALNSDGFKSRRRHVKAMQALRINKANINSKAYARGYKPKQNRRAVKTV